MQYTVEIYRRDRRRKTGERLIDKQDVDGIDAAVSWPLRQGEGVAIHQTWVTRENFLTGRQYQERYDTPRHCSPASETYWSM